MTTRKQFVRILVCGLIAFGLVPFAAIRAAQGQAAPPAREGIVFVGSSIFHRWTNLEKQMAPLPVVNLAFDGSQTSDMLRMLDARVLPYAPRVVVYYCGSNDISVGEPAAAIFGRIRERPRHGFWSTRA